MKVSFVILFFLMSHNLFSQTIEDKVYLMNEVDKIAEFPGGIYAFRKLAMQKVHYPSFAKRNGTTGTVILEIIIDEKGLPIIKVSEDIGYGCGDAAVQGFKQITQIWKPALKNGSPVKMKFIEKVHFKLDRDSSTDTSKVEANQVNSSIENILEEFQKCVKTNNAKGLLDLSAGELEMEDIQDFLKDCQKYKCLQEFIMSLKVKNFFWLNLIDYSLWEHPLKGDITIDFSYNEKKKFYYLSGCSTDDISCK